MKTASRLWTRHAQLRASQRSVRPADADIALAWGCMICHGNGCASFHLGYKEWATAQRQGVQVSDRSLGTVVVLGCSGKIVTVYRTTDRHRLKTRFPRRKKFFRAQRRVS
jgi:hypothetical protein